VVEDDRDLAGTIAKGLRAQAMAVDLAFDGAQAIERIELSPYDVVVLDRDLPETHGDDVCRFAVQRADAPRVLMLTASGGLEQRVEGLALGADDYLPKPFAFTELVARIRAIARRPSRSLAPVLVAGDLAFDLGRRRVERAGAPIALTAKECAVLEVLMTADGRLVSAEELLERAWDENVDPFTATVRVTIANLRRKLGDPPVIETVIGAGYRITAEDA
jgi:DNA-binding response OmpR family regulator